MSEKIVHSAIQVDDLFSPAFDKLNRRLETTSTESARTKKSLDALNRSLTDQVNRLSMTAKDYDLYQASLMGATREQKAHIAAMHDQIGAMTGYSKGTRVMGNNMRWLRGMGGQLGHQVQDIAVQMQMGTNAMIVFGQQGSQIASLMGPKGAMLGGLIAVGAAMGSVLLPNLFDSKDALEKLEKSLDDVDEVLSDTSAGTKILSEDFLQLAKRSRDVAEIQLFAKQLESVSALELAQKALIESSEDLFVNQVKIGNAARGNRNTLSRFAEEMGITNKSAKDLRNGILDLREGVEGSDDALISMVKNLVDAGEGGTESFNRVIGPIAKAAIKMGEAKDNAEAIAEAIRDLDSALKESERQFSKTSDKYGDELDKILSDRKKALDAASDLDISLSMGGGDDALGRLQKTMNSRMEIANKAYSTGVVDFETHNERMLEIGRIYGESVDQLNADRHQKEIDAQNAHNEKMQRLFSAVYSDDELEGDTLSSIQNSMAERIQIYNEAYDAEFLTAQQHAERMTLLGQSYSDAVTSAAQAQAEVALSTTQQTMAGLQNLFEEGSSGAKAFFLFQQTLAAGDAIIKGFQSGMAAELAFAELAALTANPTLIGVGKAANAASVASGFASAGAIMGQTVASFDGGGITFNGPRAGGMDNKGGKLIMAHPREKVLTEEQQENMGGGTNVNIYPQFMDAAGAERFFRNNKAMFVGMVKRAMSDNGGSL